MPKREINEFAKLLVREVRDRAIANCDMLLEREGNSPMAKRWRGKLDSGSCMELARTIIPDCVDQTLFYLLQAIDSGALRLSFVESSGTLLNLTDDGMGELAGWYAGVDPWISEYSQQRFVDDFADLQ